MAVSWQCDICGKQTWVNPPFEQECAEVEETIEVPMKVIKEDENGNRYAEDVMKEHVTKKKVPLTVKLRRQNIHTGHIELIEVPKLKYLKPKAVIVQLKIGDETIQKDFCQDCYKKSIHKSADKLWSRLQIIESK